MRKRFHYFKTSAEIIRFAVMMYVRFPLVRADYKIEDADVRKRLAGAGPARLWRAPSGRPG